MYSNAVHFLVGHTGVLNQKRWIYVVFLEARKYLIKDQKCTDFQRKFTRYWGNVCWEQSVTQHNPLAFLDSYINLQ